MRFLIFFFAFGYAHAGSEIAYQNFINDLVDAFRKPFQEKLLEISTNTFFEKNSDDTVVQFYSTIPGTCPNMIANSPTIVSEIKMTVGHKPEKTYQNILYSGCERVPLFREFMLIKGKNLKKPDLNTLLRQNLVMSLSDDETERNYFIERKGIRLFQIVTKRTGPNQYLARFELTSTPIITIYTKTDPNFVRLKLRVHSLTHQYIGSTDSFRLSVNQGGTADLIAELHAQSTLVKYFDHDLTPISKKDFDEAYNAFFISSLKNTVALYFNGFLRQLPKTQAVVDTRGSTEFLNKLKEVYQLLLIEQPQNAQKIVEQLISDIESGKTSVQEKSE